MPDPAERLARLALARSQGIGPALYFRLLARFGSAAEALAALPRLIAAGRLPRVIPATRDRAAAELAAAEAFGAQVVLHGEPGYPPILATLDDPPLVLTYLGRSELLDQPAVAIVGARNASANGCSLARALAKATADVGLTVVSGLARGIDAAAHEGALLGAASTIAVTASGVDIAYPPENAQLLERIAASGLVISERPMRAEPRAQHFPRRNRLIAALSLGVVVVEAAERSGSLMTARLAAELGREVMAVPGTPLDPRHRGTNQLLREGATLVESASDIVSALGPAARGTPPRHRPSRRRMQSAEVARPACPTRDQPAAAAPAATVADGQLSPLARQIDACLAPEPLAVDELVRQCGVAAAEVQQALFELELEGRIAWYPGNRVARVSG